ncbi:DUF5786 family protein [Halogeometricum sp. S3BR5-2]|uniref:DUF5786 family protein n=2 Tax=Halogeometricum luteum TaxID=2950537 RepID=A0ABU2G5C8_9EURY|nr:DUF5786 family protein [Halogeometricum sp. S3BR5-2]MDS0295980.1 DUF5786 family protein [Halogeometricum sp. S3BR5-2]
MGAYDDDEHERRERKNGSVDADFDDDRRVYRGEMTYDAGDSAEDLLDQFREMQERST